MIEDHGRGPRSRRHEGPRKLETTSSRRRPRATPGNREFLPYSRGRHLRRHGFARGEWETVPGARGQDAADVKDARPARRSKRRVTRRRPDSSAGGRHRRGQARGTARRWTWMQAERGAKPTEGAQAHRQKIAENARPYLNLGIRYTRRRTFGKPETAFAEAARVTRRRRRPGSARRLPRRALERRRRMQRRPRRCPGARFEEHTHQRRCALPRQAERYERCPRARDAARGEVVSSHASVFAEYLNVEPWRLRGE